MYAIIGGLLLKMCDFTNNHAIYVICMLWELTIIFPWYCIFVLVLYECCIQNLQYNINPSDETEFILGRPYCMYCREFHYQSIYNCGVVRTVNMEPRYS